MEKIPRCVDLGLEREMKNLAHEIEPVGELIYALIKTRWHRLKAHIVQVRRLLSGQEQPRK